MNDDEKKKRIIELLKEIESKELDDKLESLEKQVKDKNFEKSLVGKLKKKSSGDDIGILINDEDTDDESESDEGTDDEYL